MKNEPFKEIVSLMAILEVVRVLVVAGRNLSENPIKLGPVGLVEHRVADAKTAVRPKIGADGPAGDALDAALDPPPSRTLRLGTPFRAAFMPLVPEAS